MKKFSAGLIAALALAALPVSGQDLTNDDNDQVNIRAIHAVPGAPEATISIGNTPLFNNVAFKQVTAFKALPQQNDKTVTIKLADGRELKTEEQFSFDDDDTQYTILIAPDESGPNPKVVLLKDDDEAVDSDETEVTLINASPGNKSLSVRVGDNRLEGGVNYTQADDEDVAPGTYNLQVIDSANDTPVVSRSVTFTGGTAVSIVVMGQDAVKIVNNEMPDQDLGGQTGAAAATTTGTRGMMTTGTAAMTPSTNNMNTMTTGTNQM